MVKERGIAAFYLLCFLCVATTIGTGLMVFAAEGKQVRPLLINTGKNSTANPPLGSNEPHNYMASHQKLRHLMNIKASQTNVPTQAKGNSTTTWCVAKPTTSWEKLDDIIDFCCTQPNVDCKVIQRGGMCYFPPNKISDASVVMNIYYAINGKHPFDCYFKGSGLIVTQDPSVGKCIYKT